MIQKGREKATVLNAFLTTFFLITIFDLFTAPVQ